MGKLGKLISGIILLFIGIGIAYLAYANNLIDLILILGLLLTLVGFALIMTYAIDSSADQTRAFIKDYVGKKSAINIPEINFRGTQPPKSQSLSNGPLRIRREFDNYDEEFYGDDETYIEDEISVFQDLDDNPNRVLRPRNLDEETIDFGGNLDFIPNYDKPIKITRAPKKRDKDFFEIEDEYIFDGEDKSESIKQALSEDIPDLRPQQEIKIDVNNPDSLPIPKNLNSYVIADGEILTTSQAFDRLSYNIKKEIMLEIPSLADLSEKFLSNIPTIYARVIIEEFDVSNISYMILVASLLKQGVQIKTLDQVNGINLIVDDDYAMILSKGRGGSEVEYGAIYSDRNALSEIRFAFDRTWQMAKELDKDIILKYMEGGD